MCVLAAERGEEVETYGGSVGIQHGAQGAGALLSTYSTTVSSVAFDVLGSIIKIPLTCWNFDQCQQQYVAVNEWVFPPHTKQVTDNAGEISC